MSSTGTGPRLTQQQADALDLRGVSVALSAGAGCGKTTVLAERFLRAVGGENPIALDRVVALTFTNKAARELRDRIRRESRARLEARPPAAEAARWRAILRGLEAARIGTFHSFCGDILRQHAIATGIDPRFTVFDEPVALAIRDEALNQTLREALAGRDPDLLELAVEFGLNIVSSSLNQLLANRSAGDLPHWAGRTPDEVVADWVATWTQSVRPRLLGEFAEQAHRRLMGLRGPDITHPKVVERRTLLDEAFALLTARDGSVETALEAIATHARMPGLTARGCWPSDELREEIKTAFGWVRDEVKALLKALTWDEATTRVAAQQGIQFARLVLRARDHYELAKRRRGGIDNDDLLLLTRGLLASHGETVRAEIAASIDLLLVDEFQDTDPIQSDIINQLAGPGIGDGRVFLVGDFKQSIYRFRGAEPSLFLDYRATFPEPGRRSLTENFRSVPAILDFVNALFSETFAGLDAVLEPGGGKPEAEPAEPAVVFLWEDPPPSGPAAPSGEKADAGARRRAEARRIAEFLRDRLDGSWQVRGADGARRAATAGDVALLFRSLSDASYYEEALAEVGLDYHVVGGSGFFAQQEVCDVINLLTAIEDPLDAVALAGALRSPAFSISDESLFWLVQDHPGRPHAGLTRAEGDWLDRLPEVDRDRVPRARTLLEQWRTCKDRQPIAATVEMVLEESGYEAALLGETLGDRKRANARKLVRMARAFDEQGGFGLADFVARLRSDLRAATKENQAATTDETGPIVRLMSIHQAKGLEFPIVVLPDLDRKRPGDLKRVAFDGTLGPLVNPVVEPGESDDPEASGATGGSLGWILHRHLETRADDAEALRLFYVATTRARDFLVLSAAADPTRKPTSPALKLLDERFDRLSGRMAGPLPEGLREPRVAVVTPGSPSPDPARGPATRGPQRLLDVARVVREALDGSTDGEPASDIPLTVPPALDLDPARGLSTRAARRDRLLRAIIADPRSLDPAQWPRIAARAARLQEPVAPPGLIAEVLEWLSAPTWRAEVGKASHAPFVTRGEPWSLAVADLGPPVVLSGRIDYAYDDADGGMTVLQASGPDAHHEPEWLRLVISAQVARAGRGEVPIRWRLVRFTPGGPTVEQGRWSSKDRGPALRAVLVAAPRPGD